MLTNSAHSDEISYQSLHYLSIYTMLRFHLQVRKGLVNCFICSALCMLLKAPDSVT